MGFGDGLQEFRVGAVSVWFGTFKTRAVVSVLLVALVFSLVSHCFTLGKSP